MKVQIWALSLILLIMGISPAAAQTAGVLSQTSDLRGTLNTSGWILDYPDFVLALQEEKWSWILKASTGNSIGADDYASFILTDAAGKELMNDSGFSSGANGTIEFSDYISGSDFTGIDLSQPLKGTIKVNRGYGSKLKDTIVVVSIPVTDFPKRPNVINEFFSLTAPFLPVTYPQSCTSIEFQFTVNDPYSEISNITFVINDSTGKEVANAYAFGLEIGVQKEDILLCPSSLGGTIAPYSLITKVSFNSKTGKLALSESTSFPLVSKKDEALEKAKTLGDYCAKGKVSKIVKSGLPCPAGYKKVNFIVPDEIAWNSLTRAPNSQKNKNYIIYACVAQFDANTGGSKFRGYASPVPLQYYFSGGVNTIFTGSAKQLLQLSDNSAFIAKVTVSGGVTYATIGGKTSVPSFEIKQFQIVGKC